MEGFEVKEKGPGYFSLVIRKLKDNHGFAQEIQSRFSPIQGIRHLHVDPHEGVLTVAYDQQKLSSLVSLLSLKEAFTAIFPEMQVAQLANWFNEHIQKR
jgi:hypothetical protein